MSSSGTKPGAHDAMQACKPLDLCGENGEFHTMCLDGPLYQQEVDASEAVSMEVEELLNQRGQKDGERWWCLKVRTPGVAPIAAEDVAGPGPAGDRKRKCETDGP